MSRKIIIDSNFWKDPWVVDNLDPLEAHLFMYLFTNSAANPSGAYQLSIKVMSFEVGIEKDKLPTMLRRLEPKVYYRDGWVILRNGIKNQNYHSPKMQVSILSWIEKCPADLRELINWPEDFGVEKPAENAQQQLIVDIETDNFDSQNNRSKTNSWRSKKSQSVVESDNNRQKSPLSNSTTSSSVKYGIDTVSHNKYRYNNKDNSPAARGRKTAYRAAVDADKQQAEKAEAATERKGSFGPGYDFAKQKMAELKQKREAKK